MADTLAKQVVRKAKNDPSLILNINDIQQEFCFSPKWNGVYIDHSLRKFIGIITKNIVTAKWILLKTNRQHNHEQLDTTQ